jgi:hypothetical protein
MGKRSRRNGIAKQLQRRQLHAALAADRAILKRAQVQRWLSQAPGRPAPATNQRGTP